MKSITQDQKSEVLVRNALILIFLRLSVHQCDCELIIEETLAWDKQCLNWLREDSVQIYFCLQGDIISSFIPLLKFFPEHLWVNFGHIKMRKWYHQLEPSVECVLAAMLLRSWIRAIFFPSLAYSVDFRPVKEKIASGTFPPTYVRYGYCSCHGQTVLQPLEHV